ncbi:MAG TPA: hypothetical protein VI757_16490 [Bacteroidia bacterium]|nr:hypothetical protein [Bacteroidia bacterium]
MSNQNFSVTIPVNAQELGGLSQRILDKHVLDGAASVLTPMDMADMQTKTTFAKTRDADSKQNNRDKETAFQDRDLALGMETTNPGTVFFYTKSSRDVLLGFNKGKEQNLGNHGFNVNMSSGNVSVEIPTDAPGLMDLADLIIKKHLLDGPIASPLKGLNMGDFAAKLATAVAKHKEGKQLNRDKEKATGERDKTLGIAKGQKVDTPGTVKFYVTSGRDVLLGHNKGSEFNLGDWGFDVQFSSGPGAPTGTFTATPSSIAAGEPSTLEWNISGAATVVIDNGIGAVAASGTQIVSPPATTTYHLTATASGGETLNINITVTVS